MSMNIAKLSMVKGEVNLHIDILGIYRQIEIDWNWTHSVRRSYFALFRTQKNKEWCYFHSQEGYSKDSAMKFKIKTLMQQKWEG